MLAAARGVEPGDVADPDEILTREAAIRMLVEAVAPDYLNKADLRVLDAVTDADQISAGNRAAVAFALLHGVVQGRPEGNLDPQAPVTQAEAIKMIALAVPEPLPEGTDKVTILSYNDFHGRLIQDSQKRPGRDLGAEVLATAIKGQELKYPKMALFDGGDTFQGTPISNLVNGRSVLEWRNSLGVDAATLGNHEFDWPREIMIGLMQDSNFPVVSANIFLEGQDVRPEWLAPSAMIRVAEYDIGVIGITTPETKVTTLPANVADLEFRDPTAVINEEARRLRAEGAELVVLLIHDSNAPGADDPALVEGNVAAYMKGVTERIDAIVGGHSHQLVAGYVVDGRGVKVPIAQAGTAGQALARIELYIDAATGAVTRAVPFYFQPSPTLAPNPTAAEIMAKWIAEVEPIQQQPVGKLAHALTTAITDAGESMLGDFITDAMLSAPGEPEIALLNGGGIRANVDPNPATGEVTYGQWYTVQPFANTMVIFEMTGAELKQTLEEGVNNYVNLVTNQPGSAKPIQVAGIHFTWDFARPFGERVIEVTLPDGTPLDMEKTYKVIVNNFMATGGDNFATLGQLYKAGKALDLGLVDLDITVDYFKKLAEQGPITYELQNRIKVVNFPAE